MAFDLSELQDSLKRAVSVPGLFATDFPNTSSNDIDGLLQDAFGECQLDGFFSGLTLDSSTVSTDLSRGEQALIVIYAAGRMLSSELRNRKSKRSYKAGPVEFSEEQGVATLTQQLKSLEERKKELRAQGLQGDAGSAFYMADMYLMRSAGISVWP